MAAQAGTVRLRPPRNRVDRRAVGWWFTQGALSVLVLAAALAVLAAVLDQVETLLLLAAVVVLALGVPYTVLMPLWRYRVHRWETTQDAVYTRTGWLWQEWRIAPMSRIQTIDTGRGPLEQLFGLASITVTTASAAGPLKISGVGHELAAELVQLLTATTQSAAGDAT